jgi:DNA-binding response OmpR family regulator
MMVLVIIRDAALRQVVARLVRRGGFGAVAVNDFAHARILTLGSPVAVGALIADLPADDDEVWACVGALRRWHARTPTIVLSHLAAMDDRFLAPGLPAIHWMEKPFAMEALLGALAGALAGPAPEARAGVQLAGA